MLAGWRRQYKRRSGWRGFWETCVKKKKQQQQKFIIYLISYCSSTSLNKMISADFFPHLTIQ